MSSTCVYVALLCGLETVLRLIFKSSCRKSYGNEIMSSN
jgi:hypothetical protein